MVINNNHLYLTKLVGDTLLWYEYPCFITKLVRYFCGTSDTSGTSNASNTANSSDASKTSVSVTRLSNYYYRRKILLQILH